MHSLINSFIYSIIPLFFLHSLIKAFIQPLIYSFINSIHSFFLRSFIHSFIQLSMQSFIAPKFQPFNPSANHLIYLSLKQLLKGNHRTGQKTYPEDPGRPATLHLDHREEGSRRLQAANQCQGRLLQVRRENQFVQAEVVLLFSENLEVKTVSHVG